MSLEQDHTTFDSENFLKTLTRKPGVYQMLDARGHCIYVGKAKNLKKRVTSYFRKNDGDPKKRVMLSHLANIEVIVTHTEGEALLLENQLIKRHRPRYNICLRDDKSYPYIYLSSHQQYPRVTLHRGARNKPGRYFGPYPSASAARESLQLLQKLFPVRQCEDGFFRNRSRPCLQYQIKRCSGPCVGLISEQDYAQDVEHTHLFLEGKSARLIDQLVQSMEQAAATHAYEKAAAFRDQIASLRKVMERQYVSGSGGDLDVIACDVQSGMACVQVFFIRNGLHVGNKTLFPRLPGEHTPEDVLSAFLPQFYLDKQIPRTLLLSHPVNEQALIKEALESQSGRSVSMTHRPRKQRARWLAMALDNARNALRQKLTSQDHLDTRFVKLAELLAFGAEITRLECFDISHIQGDQTVASCVVFDRNGPLKEAYRRFNIRQAKPGDDYAALSEAVSRRFQRLQRGEHRAPDVLIIDGGKGQVHAVLDALRALSMEDVFVLGVSKGADRKPGMEKLFVGQTATTITPPADAPGLLLIQHIRDEAHRFAISGHRQQRAKARRISPLEQIDGLGPKRRQQLLKQFGGLREIASAGVEDLCTIPGISKSLGQRIYDHFHS